MEGAFTFLSTAPGSTPGSPARKPPQPLGSLPSLETLLCPHHCLSSQRDLQAKSMQTDHPFIQTGPDRSFTGPVSQCPADARARCWGGGSRETSELNHTCVPTSCFKGPHQPPSLAHRWVEKAPMEEQLPPSGPSGFGAGLLSPALMPG